MNASQPQYDQPVLISPRKARKLRWILLGATVLFFIGIVAPMMTISKFVLVKNSFSVFSGVLELFRNGQFLLFLIVAGFSIVLPILKIGVLFALMSRRAQQSEKLGNYLHLMHEYGRWAMLDVMVVAILIVAVKLGAIVTVEIHYGLFVFGAAVLLIMLLTRSVVRLTGKNGG
ncbi:MAG: paraquat-inducible protein A [Gammaproteobacteria bacterium]|nr:paraquat-inducible protein A [Gammaproteobacteria bacterium]